MKTNRNSGSTAKLMGRLFVAHYRLPLPLGEGWGEGRRTRRAGLSSARLLADRVAPAATSDCGNATPHPSPLPEGEGASFLRQRRRSRNSRQGQRDGGSRNRSGGKHAVADWQLFIRPPLAPPLKGGDRAGAGFRAPSRVAPGITAWSSRRSGRARQNASGSSHRGIAVPHTTESSRGDTLMRHDVLGVVPAPRPQRAPPSLHGVRKGRSPVSPLRLMSEERLPELQIPAKTGIR
jgi:hypothetical protein